MEKQEQNTSWKKEWQKEAAVLFFMEKKSITEIAEKLPISRKSIGKFLKEQPEYFFEKIRRKEETKEKRKDYQREWDRKKRSKRYDVINAETLQREHALAALILSREKF